MSQEHTLSTLKAFQNEVSGAINAYFAANHAQKAAPNGIQAYELLREFTQRPGKRVRGILAIVAYEMFGGTSHKTALDMAVAIELVQSFLLIIDDVMDHSKTRRGGSTVHEQYFEQLAKDFADPKARHLSNMLGVSVGVIAQHMAAELLANLDGSATDLRRVQTLFHKNILATCYGQIEDLYSDATQKRSKEDEILQIYALKNSYYTFINPLQTGAALAGASENDLSIMNKFGIHAGVAFQLHDDLIGIFGDENKTGKSNMDDLREGKMTLLIHHGLTHGNQKQAAAIKAALGNDKITNSQHLSVQTILQEVGSRQYVTNMAKQEVDKALGVLAEFKHYPRYDFLTELLKYMIEREN